MKTDIDRKFGRNAGGAGRDGLAQSAITLGQRAGVSGGDVRSIG
jgi:hypothetical protein